MIIDIAVLAASTLGGGLVGGFLGARFRRRPPGAPPKYTCGCVHSLALHDEKTGKCHGKTRRQHYQKSGTRNGHEWASCDCQRYVGDRPPEEIDWTKIGLPSPPGNAGQ